MKELLRTQIVTVDLDSTLYDTSHRHHMIDRVNGTDWDAYSRACSDDVVIAGVRNLCLLAHSAGVAVHYVTGRTEAGRKLTEAKLKKDGLPVDGLWMDDTETADHITEFGSHAKYKVARILDVIRATRGAHLFHLDDYAEVYDECAKVGLACICVRAPHEIAELVAQGVSYLA